MSSNPVQKRSDRIVFPDNTEQLTAAVVSLPASGKYRVLKISVDTETKELVIETKDTPEP